MFLFCFSVTGISVFRQTRDVIRFAANPLFIRNECCLCFCSLFTAFHQTFDPDVITPLFRSTLLPVRISNEVPETATRGRRPLTFDERVWVVYLFTRQEFEFLPELKWKHITSIVSNLLIL